MYQKATWLVVSSLALTFSFGSLFAEETPAASATSTVEKSADAPKVERQRKEMDPAKIAERQQKMKEMRQKHQEARAKFLAEQNANAEKFLATAQNQSDAEIAGAVNEYWMSAVKGKPRHANTVFNTLKGKIATTEMDAAKKAKLLDGLKDQYIQWIEDSNPRKIAEGYFEKMTDEKLAPEARQALRKELQQKMQEHAETYGGGFMARGDKPMMNKDGKGKHHGKREGGEKMRGGKCGGAGAGCQKGDGKKCGGKRGEGRGEKRGENPPPAPQE